jgi:hypothetical protein
MKRLLNFATDDMSLRDQKHLIEALTTVSDVLSGLQEQSRFGSPGGYNNAGGFLERLRVWVGFEIDHMREVAAKRSVPNRDDAEEKFEILLADCVGNGECPASVVAKLATLVSEMDWELRMAMPSVKGSVL